MAKYYIPVEGLSKNTIDAYIKDLPKPANRTLPNPVNYRVTECNYPSPNGPKHWEVEHPDLTVDQVKELKKLKD